VNCLRRFAEAEGVKVAKGVIPLVVRASGGSVRDAQSVLVSITLLVPAKMAVTLRDRCSTSRLRRRRVTRLMQLMRSLRAMAQHFLQQLIVLSKSGHDPRRFASDLLERLRDLMIVDAHWRDQSSCDLASKFQMISWNACAHRQSTSVALVYSRSSRQLAAEAFD
jgi:DNA polymerase III gamma/tau subunit